MLLAAVVIAVIVAVAVFLSLPHAPNKPLSNQTLENLSSADPYAHLSTATFALVSPYPVFSKNQRFVGLARKTYNFIYSDASDFRGAENSSFIVIVVNSSSGAYADLASHAVNGLELAYALNRTNGIIMNSSNVWAKGQTVFVLAGYKNGKALASALLSFFVRQPLYLPRGVAGGFISFNGIRKKSNANGLSANDPVVDAYLDGTYELGPSDTSLYYPYSYYDNFAYLLYYAPVISSIIPGVEGNSSGLGLPMGSLLCIPPPPPPDGSSLCIGDYVAMPMLQIGSAPPARPQWNFDTGDCNFLGIDDCIDAEGWAASGINPQLPYREIPSVYYGFTSTGSGIPPSMTGTSGPASDYLPLTWWVYGPGSLGESTGGFQAGVANQNEISLLLDAGVEMFSAPLGETPFGNFTATNSSSTYSCSSSLCGMHFNYSIYALLTTSSTIPKGANIYSPYGYSQAPYSNYTAVLEPVTLTTPKIVKSTAATYYFSYWSVYSELDGNQYYQQFNTSNATFRVIGPTQAQAVYTARSVPGKVTMKSEYLTISDFLSCPPPLNCTTSAATPIPDVNVSLEGMNGLVLYSNTTGSSGIVTTQTMQAGCYKVTAVKKGYNFITDPNPVCVNGNTDVYLVDTGPFILNLSWPSIYPYAGAPQNSRIQINLTLLYAGGKGFPAANLTVHAAAGSGTITAAATTSSAGRADLVWNAGSASGLYDLNFTVTGTFIPAWKYSLPVVVYSGNYSRTFLKLDMANSTVSASPGASLTDNITLSLCKYSFNPGANAALTCMQAEPYPANISISYIHDRPADTSITFVPNPAQPTANLTDSTTMHITIGSNAQKGAFPAYINAEMITPTGQYNATAPFLLDLSSGANSTGNSTASGALSINVFFNKAPAAGAEINSPPYYHGWYTDSNGEYYTGYTIKPGTYELIGTYDNISNSTTVAVSPGRAAHANIYIYG